MMLVSMQMQSEWRRQQQCRLPLRQGSHRWCSTLPLQPPCQGAMPIARWPSACPLHEQLWCYLRTESRDGADKRLPT